MNLTLVEESLYVMCTPVGVAAYDFDFELNFACRHPYIVETPHPCVARIGAIHPYDEHCARLQEIGLVPVNSPAQHTLASELEAWYPHLVGLTPRTVVYDALPDVDEVDATFGWPVFLKGSRQTSKHDPELAVIRNPAHYAVAMGRYSVDPILRWQRPALREFVPLAPVPGAVAGKVRPSIEFRSFWWHGRCVGWGRYWYQVAPYACPDEDAGRALAALAASRLDVPFLVIDVARTADGRWIVIECNEGQESGHGGIVPQQLWRNVLDAIARDR